MASGISRKKIRNLQIRSLYNAKLEEIKNTSSTGIIIYYENWIRESITNENRLTEEKTISGDFYLNKDGIGNVMDIDQMSNFTDKTYVAMMPIPLKMSLNLIPS